MRYADGAIISMTPAVGVVHFHEIGNPAAGERLRLVGWAVVARPFVNEAETMSSEPTRGEYLATSVEPVVLAEGNLVVLARDRLDDYSRPSTFRVEIARG